MTILRISPISVFPKVPRRHRLLRYAMPLALVGCLTGCPAPRASPDLTVIYPDDGVRATITFSVGPTGDTHVDVRCTGGAPVARKVRCAQLVESVGP